MGAPEQGCGVRPQARVPKETEAQRGVASCRSSRGKPGNPGWSLPLPQECGVRWWVVSFLPGPFPIAPSFFQRTGPGVLS